MGATAKADDGATEPAVERQKESASGAPASAADVPPVAAKCVKSTMPSESSPKKDGAERQQGLQDVKPSKVRPGKEEAKAGSESESDDSNIDIDLQTDSLFAFNSISSYAQIFGDIREDDDDKEEFRRQFMGAQEQSKDADLSSMLNKLSVADAKAKAKPPGSSPSTVQQPASTPTISTSATAAVSSSTPSTPTKTKPKHTKHKPDVTEHYPFGQHPQSLLQVGAQMMSRETTSPSTSPTHEDESPASALESPTDAKIAAVAAAAAAAASRKARRAAAATDSGADPAPRGGRPSGQGGVELPVGGTEGNGRVTKQQATKALMAVIQTAADVTGKVYELSQDQNGCRYLQSVLAETEPGPELTAWTDVIFNEVFQRCTQLMMDPFGNYLCQKLLEKCSEEQRARFIKQVSPDIVPISLNIHGTRAVQKLIDCVDQAEQISMVATALGQNVVPLIKDLNGNHVIQRCLQKFGTRSSQFIFDAVAIHLVDVATHRHGCCVLQRCIDHANDAQRNLLVHEIAANALRLVQDPFGNYVVQYVLDLCPPTEQHVIIVKFIGSVSQLSTQKFSSNVIEKCLEIADPKVQMQFLLEISGDASVPVLLNDPYGNYVMQRALAVADERMFDLLCSRIRPHIPSLRSTPYGKRIHNKLLKKFPVLSSPNHASGPPVHPATMHPRPPADARMAPHTKFDMGSHAGQPLPPQLQHPYGIPVHAYAQLPDAYAAAAINAHFLAAQSGLGAIPMASMGGPMMVMAPPPLAAGIPHPQLQAHHGPMPQTVGNPGPGNMAALNQAAAYYGYGVPPSYGGWAG